MKGELGASFRARKVRNVHKNRTKTKTKRTVMGVYQKGTGENERVLKGQNSLSNKILKLDLDYNPKYKITIHESTLI